MIDIILNQKRLIIIEICTYHRKIKLQCKQNNLFEMSRRLNKSFHVFKQKKYIQTIQFEPKGDSLFDSDRVAPSTRSRRFAQLPIWRLTNRHQWQQKDPTIFLIPDNRRKDLQTSSRDYNQFFQLPINYRVSAPGRQTYRPHHFLEGQDTYSLTRFPINKRYLVGSRI